MAPRASLLWFASIVVSACGGTESADPEDCAGVQGGDAVVDECGTCDDDPDNDCAQDCAGDWGGDATLDDCNTCDDDPTNDCTQDCAGDWGGDATVDSCGTCDADPDNDCTQDCAGDWGGDAVLDECGTCDDDPENDCEQDCAGDWGGDAVVDECGTCDDDPENDCEQDCAGHWGGDAVRDNCDTCDADPDNDCVQDCAGVWGGDAVLDNCDTCDADPANDCVQDCAGVWGGRATVDACGVCDADPQNDCVIDCLGVRDGRAYLDRCGVCIDRDAGEPFGLWGDETTRRMDAGCSQVLLPEVLLAEGIELSVRAESVAISDAWVYLLDTHGNVTASVELNPANFGWAEATVDFDVPAEVERLQICSWWNPASLAYVQILGDADACTGDCADHWPDERAYRDTCDLCIDRDAAPPEVLFRDETVRWMGPNCSDHDIPGSFLVEELFATAQNIPGAISDAWVYLQDPAGNIVGSLEMNPADMNTVSGTAVFDPPIPVSAMHICSWWNAANLLDVQLLGDPLACAP